SRQLTKLNRELAILDHKKPSGRLGFGPKKNVHGHLICALGKQIPAHVPRRRMHGVDANGFRSRPPALEQARRASRKWRPRAPLRIRAAAIRLSREAFRWILR